MAIEGPPRTAEGPNGSAGSAATPDGQPLGPCVVHPSRDTARRCLDCRRYICHDCASWVRRDDAVTSERVCPACAPAHVVESSIPWDREPSWSNYWATFRAAYDPRGADWRAVPARPLAGPILFSVLAGVPASTLHFLWRIIKFSLGLWEYAGEPDPMTDLGVSGATLRATMVAVPVLWLALMPLWAFLRAVLYYFAALAVGAHKPFGCTFRAQCYLAPLSLVRFLPMVGFVIGMLFEILSMFGFSERTLGLTRWRAVMVALFPAAFIIVIIVGESLLLKQYR